MSETQVESGLPEIATMEPSSGEHGRHLSVEIRASMFKKIFEPTVQKMYVPVVLEACETFETRKGAFAALGRCAKCNFREAEHKSFDGPQELPRWVKGKSWTRARADAIRESFAAFGLQVSSDFKPEDAQPTAESANVTPAAQPENQEKAEKLQAEVNDTTPTNENPVETVEPTPVVSNETNPAEEEALKDMDGPINDHAEDLQETTDAIPDDEEEHEENVRRPSWAPPPLIDVDSDASSISSPSPPHTLSKQPGRRLSWLSPRSRSSSNSDASPSPEMRPRRNSLRLLATQIRSKMTKAKDTWESKIGDSLPNCNRCGRPIEPSHKIVTAGMARAHEVCPSKEESERGPRNPRYMVQKAQDRIVLTFRCDKETKQPYSFIYDIDRESKQKCLRMRNNEEMTLVYVPDSSSHSSLERRFKVPKAREFDVSVRYTHNFVFTNPATNETFAPQLNEEARTVEVVKFCVANQVLHKITATFVYDEENRVLSPLKLTFSFSLMPGALNRLHTIVSRGPTDGIAKRLEEKLKAVELAKAEKALAEQGTPQSTVEQPTAVELEA